MLGFGRKKENKKILVVEDDALLAKVLIDSLGAEGFEALNVNNGLEAFNEAKKFKPDLVLLDLILPGIDGFEVLKQLKGDNETKKVPVFVLSNLDSAPDVKSVKALEAEEYFIKANIKMKKIIEAINNRLK